MPLPSLTPPSPMAITILISVSVKAFLELHGNESQVSCLSTFDNKYMGIFWLPLCSVELYGCTCTSASQSCLLLFYGQSWIQVVSPPTLFCCCFFFSKLLASILSPLFFPCKFQNCFSNDIKKPAGILFGNNYKLTGSYKKSTKRSCVPNTQPLPVVTSLYDYSALSKPGARLAQCDLTRPWISLLFACSHFYVSLCIIL